MCSTEFHEWLIHLNNKHGQYCHNVVVVSIVVCTVVVFSVVVILFSLVTVYPVEFPVVQPVKLPELIVWELIAFGSFYLLPLQFQVVVPDSHDPCCCLL